MLRDEFQELAALPQPDVVAMLGRLKRRRRRHGIGAVAGALAVLAILAGIILTVGESPPPPAAATLPANLAVTGPPQVHFVDADHGFALASSCPASAGACGVWLANTSDGGRSWQAHQVPDLTYPNTDEGAEPRVNLRVLDASRAALDGYDGDRRWFTTDAGATWTQPSPRPDGVVDSIPANGLAQVESNAGGPIGIVVLLPDGRSARLATPPVAPLIESMTDVAFGADGSAWVEGGNDDRSWVFVSRNRGRSWNDVPLPAEAAEPGVPHRTTGRLAVHDGRTAFLVDAYGYRLWRTTDDGRHWVALTAPISKPSEDIGMKATPEVDGGLTVFDILTGRSFTLPGNGERFAPVTAAERRPSDRIGARFLAGSGQSGQEPPYFHSSDRRSWTELRF
ncbi:hypothetical protein [Asanoa siamensis]|uniref:hypothetical protein n=1 Tax=Asanoa siamensis TaxID=926357 RepID=UPI001941FAF1|nr:hypothetical protein [Asanoa siamensis]